MICELCRLIDVAWVHELDPARSSFRQYGKGHVWANQIFVCDRCDQLFRNGDSETLVALQVGDAELGPDVIDETLRKPFTVYRAAHLRTIAYADFLPAGVSALRAEGFVPVEELTGDHSVFGAWPVEHRRAVPETRAEWLDRSSGEGEFQLIRSPWPGIPVADVFGVIWGYIHPRAPIVDNRIDPDQHRAAITEFTHLEETDVAALIADARARDED